MSVRVLLTRVVAKAFAVAAVAAVAPAAAQAQASSSPVPQDAQHCLVLSGIGQISCAATEDDLEAQLTCADFGQIRGAKFWSYRYFNSNGGTWTVCVPRRCSVTYENEGRAFNYPDLSGIGWNNRISSLRTFSR